MGGCFNSERHTLCRGLSLMRASFNAIGKGIRACVAPFIRLWRLPMRLDETRDRLGSVETGVARLTEGIARLTEGVARLTKGFDAQTGVPTAETDRLDGYIAHHAAKLSEDISDIGRALRHRSEIAYTMPGLDSLIMAGGWDLVVPAEEIGLLVYLHRHGPEDVEPGVRRVLRDRLKTGGTAVDIGANIGLHAVVMAACIGQEGRLVCFEPLPHLAKSLERTLHLNGFGRQSEVRRIALADAAGEVMFHHAAHGPMSSLYPLPAGVKSETIPVHTASMDDSFPPGTRIDLVKMDVEGAEPRIWRGMKRVIADNPDIEIILEWSSSHFRRSGEDPLAFMEDIGARGFSAYVISDKPGGGLTLLDGAADLEGDSLLLTRSPAI
jgi:FkbM family methyltransferase